MVLGKPCVATGFSGNMDFMTPRNSILVPFGMRRVAKGEYPHGEASGGQNPTTTPASTPYAGWQAGRGTSRH